MNALPFIEITSTGGRIGRIKWDNTDPSVRTPWQRSSGSWGRIRWWEPWPALMASWPPLPWGPADWERDGHFADFAAFEAFLPEDIEILVEDVNDRINLYAWACNIHQHGINMGRNPYTHAHDCKEVQ